MDCRRLLEEQAQRFPEKPAYIFKGEEISFRRLKEISFKLANGLLKLEKPDKVAIYLPNCPEYIYSYLAIWCIGLTAVPLDFMLTEDEVISCLSHSEAAILITRLKANVSLAGLKKRCPGLKEIIVCVDEPEGFLSFSQILREASDNLHLRNVNDKDYAIIFYTSGTTGRPKGVLINYRQLDAPPKAMEYFVGGDIKDSDMGLCALPFSHLGGLIFIQANLSFGATVVLMERFLPLELLRNIIRYRVTWFWLVPSMYYAILEMKEFGDFDLSSLRWLVIFGAPSFLEAIRRFHQHCPKANLFHGWGLTETNAPTTVIPSGSSKIESVGRPAPWIEVEIFNEEGRQVPLGQIGEIVVRGWVVSDGYYKDAEATSLALRGGWFYTGDLGRFDQENYLYIVGRTKEMLKVGGEIVFEPEVEMVIHRHPQVAEVAVIGVSDKLRGEVPKAFVVLKEGSQLDEEVLRSFCRQHLAHFKIPHYFEFMPFLPKNRTGKIDKEQLRRR